MTESIEAIHTRGTLFAVVMRQTEWHGLVTIIQSCVPYVSGSALEIFPKLWKHTGHSGNIKGHLSARMPLMLPNFETSWEHKGHSGNKEGHLRASMPLMFPNFEKSWKHKGHSGNIRDWKQKGMAL